MFICDHKTIEFHSTHHEMLRPCPVVMLLYTFNLQHDFNHPQKRVIVQGSVNLLQMTPVIQVGDYY